MGSIIPFSHKNMAVLRFQAPFKDFSKNPYELWEEEVSSQTLFFL